MYECIITSLYDVSGKKTLCIISTLADHYKKINFYNLYPSGANQTNEISIKQKY